MNISGLNRCDFCTITYQCNRTGTVKMFGLITLPNLPPSVLSQYLYRTANYKKHTYKHMQEHIKHGTRTLNIEVVKQRSCNSTVHKTQHRMGQEHKFMNGVQIRISSVKFQVNIQNAFQYLLVATVTPTKNQSGRRASLVAALILKHLRFLQRRQ